MQIFGKKYSKEKITFFLFYRYKFYTRFFIACAVFDILLYSRIWTTKFGYDVIMVLGSSQIDIVPAASNNDILFKSVKN